MSDLLLFPFDEYWWFYAGFTLFVLLVLALDLGVFHREAHEVGAREAAAWSVLWVVLALAFNYLFYRYALWHLPQVPDMWRQAPWLGVGWGQFAWEHFLRIGAAAVQPLPGLYHHAHNVVMQILAECGLAGVAILLGGVVAWFAGLRRGAFDAELWWVLAVLAVPGLHSMIEYPLWYAYFLGITSVLLGAADARERVIAAGRLPRLVATATLLAGGFIAAHTAGRYHALELAHNPQPGSVTQEQAEQEARGLLSARGGLMDPWIDRSRWHARWAWTAWPSTPRSLSPPRSSCCHVRPHAGIGNPSSEKDFRVRSRQDFF